jgi:hypothetical protein
VMTTHRDRLDLLGRGGVTELDRGALQEAR